MHHSQEGRETVKTPKICVYLGCRVGDCRMCAARRCVGARVRSRSQVAIQIPYVMSWRTSRASDWSAIGIGLDVIGRTGDRCARRRVQQQELLVLLGVSFRDEIAAAASWLHLHLQLHRASGRGMRPRKVAG